MTTMNSSNKFKLCGGDDAFADRQKKLFDQLSIAEKEFNRHKNSDTYLVPLEVEHSDANEEQHSQRSCRKRKSETRQFRGKESIFKRPEGPAPRNNTHSIPDHHRNPNKWMKYSLDDVSNDDMTDHSNARTAFAFLKELKARRAKEEEKEHSHVPMDTNDSESISFKKPNLLTTIQFKKPGNVECSSSQSSSVVITREEKPIFLSSKIIMPEYVVGQKQKKKDKEKKVTVRARIDRTKELKLNHLQEFDEEDDQI